MNTSSAKKNAGQDTPPVKRSEVAETMQSAMNPPDTNLTASSDEALNGPVVLAQPGASTSAPTDPIDIPRPSSEEQQDSPTLTLRVVGKGKLVTVKDAVAKKYRAASQTTDGFVRESPWQSVAFAALGGLIIGMLAAR